MAAYGSHVCSSPAYQSGSGCPLRGFLSGDMTAIVPGMQSLDKFASDKLAELGREHLRRVLVDTTRDGICVERGGRRLLSFSCNDYLGLTRHPAVQEAAIAAVRRYGAGAGASRL